MLQEFDADYQQWLDDWHSDRDTDFIISYQSIKLDLWQPPENNDALFEGPNDNNNPDDMQF